VAVLVLDCDGVVVLGHPEGGRWDKHLMRDLGMKLELLQERFFRAHFAGIVTGETDLFEVLERVWPELECAATPRAFVDYWLANDSRLDFDVLATVDRWRADGGKAFLATVQEHNRARYLWDALKLREHFDGMLYSAALGARKPHPEFFERALAKLPVSSPEEILFLDDFAKNVEAAKALGWEAHLHTCADDLTRALATLPSAGGI
jgi:putative hydrolase of the HAD superfamily